jgi:multiple sugar transport system permease protein
LATQPASIERIARSRRTARATLPRWRREQGRAFALGLLPALLVLAAITLGPTLYLVITSLTPLDPVHPQSATDFSDPARNYRALMADARFLNSLLIQGKLSVATVALQLAIGLGAALLLNSGSRLLEAIRTAFILPMVLRRSWSRSSGRSSSRRMSAQRTGR